MPVALTSFSAHWQVGEVLLKCSKAAEWNFRNLVVQHSKDGRNWSNKALIATAGNSTIDQHYRYTRFSCREQQLLSLNTKGFLGEGAFVGHTHNEATAYGRKASGCCYQRHA